ncbi:hypothetical protein BDB01DRAFT_715878 [Pilobolus umbonatus]|nr:hypothetical protein BDB01DRAFT_715878 [Pilobolus umbonatus]
MKLVVVDPLYFRKYVSRIFEGDDWEAKYQSLDNIFGLFSKMDDPFLSKWMSNLSELGFLFSYFAGCLWDKEGYVRSKAITLIRTFNLLHLRSAFRCWEAHFMTATIGKRIALLHLMIQLNALFPTWQVIEWDSLLEALEDKLPSNKDNAAVDYLEDYMRSSVDSTTNNLSDQANAQESFDYDNSKLLMLTLALQMVGNRLEILPIQINRLKYIIVQNMGFKNCHFFNTSEQGAVTFGTLVFNPENTMQISLLFACIRGLKGVIDSFAPLNPKSVAQAIDSTEHIKNNFSEISSPGVYFLDIIFKMMNSGVSLTSLGHMMLKCWLEIILVVIYKHSILEQEYEQDIVSCMKQIIELLIEDISEENKLIILEILKCLLRRSDHLTAMVLSKQIFALGKLMTRTGARHSEPIFLKAKQFLKNAFLRFAVAGLFVLMFKNQTITQSDDKELDLFFILRTVIDPDDVVPDEEVHGEIIYLRDQPLRDVLDKLMKQQIERKSFSTVLYNTNKYVESVHRYPYSENILRDYSSFLNALIRHTTDWRRSDWDINPVLTMSATLLKEHRYYHATLLLSIQALLKHGLQNCFIQPESVIKLLAAYSFVSAIPGMQKQNVFVDIILDDVKNSLLSTKANKDTLLTLLQVMLWDIKPSSQAWFGEIENRFTDSKMVRERIYYFDKRMTGLTAHFVDFLQTARSKQFTKKDLKLFCVVAQLLVSICKRNNQILDETLHCLRCLNWFILTLIMEKEDLLLQILNQYESVITDILVQTFNSVHIDFNTPDLGFSYSTYYEALSLSFLLLKAWVILKLRNTSRMGDRVPISSYQNPISFWMSVWPALNRILNMVEPSTLRMVRVNVCRCNSLSANMCIFYSQEMLLDNKENTPLERNMDQSMSLDDFKNDIRKLRNMFDIPPVEVPAPVMINQMFIDLKEIMRLQAENMVIMDTRQVQEQA